MTRNETKELQAVLLRLRESVLGNMEFLTSDTLGPSSPKEDEPDSVDHESAFSLVRNDKNILVEIEDALRRIDEGTYGICELTGQPIGVIRLRAVPYARYCVQAQEEMEGNGRRRHRGVS